jgi:hypothetical protein
MSFLAKCLDVDPENISCASEYTILVGGVGNRLIIRYRAVHSCLRIERITWKNANSVAHFAIPIPGLGEHYRHKRDLYKALRAWYSEIQFRRLEHVFS